MTNHLATLEEAISDVGYWRWWAAALPDVFQVEFGGVQMHFPPATPDVAPNSVVALRFHAPSLVAFLTKDGASVEPGWRAALHGDQIEPFSVSHELFTLTSEEVWAQVAEEASLEFLVGDAPTWAGSGSVHLAFRAQEVGLLVRAESMTVIAVPGELSPGQIAQAAGDWWAYWREYWNRRETDHPMPKDYACEVTFPIA